VHNEYDYLSGSVLLRVSGILTPAEALRYKAVLAKIMNGTAHPKPKPISAPPPPPAAMRQTVSFADGSSVQVLSFAPAPLSAESYVTIPPGASLASVLLRVCAAPTVRGDTGFSFLEFTVMMTDGTLAYPALGEIDGELAADSLALSQCVEGRVGFEIPKNKIPSELLFHNYFIHPNRASWQLT
jgi:hypothetical protein